MTQRYHSYYFCTRTALIIVRALTETYAADLDDYKNLIKDFDSISELRKNYVLKTYSKGIITGYEDGEFKPKNTLTRAETVTVILRMLDSSERKTVELNAQLVTAPTTTEKVH